jgi:hypothetical protein
MIRPSFTPMQALPNGWAYRATQAGLRIRNPDGLTVTASHDLLADITDWESGAIGDRVLLARLALAV